MKPLRPAGKRLFGPRKTRNLNFALMGPGLTVLVPPSGFFFRPGKDEKTFSTVKDGGGVTCLGALLVTRLVLLALSWTIVYVSTNNDPPQHTSRLWKSYLTKKASGGVLRHMT